MAVDTQLLREIASLRIIIMELGCYTDNYVSLER